MRSRHSREFWEKAVGEVEAGAKLGTVARQRGVRPATLSWWRWRLRSEGGHAKQKRKVRRQKGPSTGQLLPVIVATGPSNAARASDGFVELFVGEVRVRVPEGTDPRYLASLAEALRAGC